MNHDETQDKLNKEAQNPAEEKPGQGAATPASKKESVVNTDNGTGRQEGETGTPDGGYSFIRQTIRKKPVDYGKIIRRFVLLLAGAAAAGAVAAVTFAAVLPQARKAMGIEEREEVRIAANGSESLASASSSASETSDHEASVEAGESVTAASAASASSEAVTSTSLWASEALSSTSGESGSTAEGVTAAPQTTIIKEAMTPDEYKVLYRQMTEASAEAEKSIVRVTAVSDMMDFFNRTYVSQNQSTGIIVARTSSNLYILVQDADIQSATTIQLTFCNDMIAEGSFVKLDPVTDLAIVTVPIQQLPSGTSDAIAIAPLGNSFAVSKGEPILAVGSPMGYSDSVIMGTITSTTNNVSLTDRQYTILTTDISASEKSSGVLVNLDGQIIGFIAQGLAEGNSQTVTGLAISRITNLIEELSNAESLPYIGIQGTDVSSELSEETGVPVGVMVTLVEPDSPAMLCGLKEGDVITQLGTNQVASMQTYMSTLSSMEEDETVTIYAMRQGISAYEEVQFDCTVQGR